MKTLLFVLVGVCWMVGLSVLGGYLFYVEEDARGARVWQETQARLKAKGETLDFEKLVPPAVPEARNLGALPIFRLETDSDGNKGQPVTLKKALVNFKYSGAWPRMETTPSGVAATPSEIESFVRERYQKVFPGQEIPRASLAQFDALYPTIGDLRREASLRPDCRFALDYTTMPPYLRSLGGITELLSLGRVITLHAKLALDAGQSALALQDVETLLKIDEGIRKEPVLISGLVAAGLAAYDEQAVRFGLHDRMWNDVQLKEIDERFAAIDFLANFQLSLRGEAVGFFAPMIDFTRDHRKDVASIIFGEGSNTAPPLTVLAGSMIPRGWFALTKAHGVEMDLTEAAVSADASRHRIFPAKFSQLAAKFDDIPLWDFPLRLLSISQGPILNSIGTFGQAQTQVDETRIACRLERYRLQQGTYPASLDDLRTMEPMPLPHDPVGGAPYRYRRNPDGTYLLYSIGWNQVDDGGKEAYEAKNPRSKDRLHGDWVWPSVAPDK